jgi:hypothetical protein
MGSRCITPRILNLSTTWRWAVAFTARCPLAGNCPEAWRKWKSIAPIGKRPRILWSSSPVPQFLHTLTSLVSFQFYNCLALSSDKWRSRHFPLSPRVINVAKCTRQASVLQALWSQRTAMSNELTVNTSCMLCHQRWLQWTASLPFNFTEAYFAKTVTTNVKSE